MSLFLFFFFYQQQRCSYIYKLGTHAHRLSVVLAAAITNCVPSGLSSSNIAAARRRRPESPVASCSLSRLVKRSNRSTSSVLNYRQNYCRLARLLDSLSSMSTSLWWPTSSKGESRTPCSTSSPIGRRLRFRFCRAASPPAAPLSNWRNQNKRKCFDKERRDTQRAFVAIVD